MTPPRTRLRCCDYIPQFSLASSQCPVGTDHKTQKNKTLNQRVFAVCRCPLSSCSAVTICRSAGAKKHLLLCKRQAQRSLLSVRQSTLSRKLRGSDKHLISLQGVKRLRLQRCPGYVRILMYLLNELLQGREVGL